MKIAASIIAAFVAATSANAFVTPGQVSGVAFQRTSSERTSLNTMADELDIPCEDDCAIESYPNLPKTVHPGVNTGQAMVDLLQHAKENGECLSTSKHR